MEYSKNILIEGMQQTHLLQNPTFPIGPDGARVSDSVPSSKKPGKRDVSSSYVVARVYSPGMPWIPESLPSLFSDITFYLMTIENSALL
jgi:hypothetical protein